MLTSVGQSAACSIVFPEDWEHFNTYVNKPVRQKADCSFDRGGMWDSIEGAPAFDVGGGRVGQFITADIPDPADESDLFIVECAEREGAVLLGVKDQKYDTSCGPITHLMSYLPPIGNFRLEEGDSFAEFVAYAKGYGMIVTEDIEFAFGMSHRKDKVDLLCGCKRFYPELMGQTN